MSNSTPLRLGIIGVNTIGSQHVARVQRSTDAELVCVSDTSESVRQRWSAEGLDVAPDNASLFGREDVDGVIIAVPSGYHATLAIEALRAGKHVLLEKPIDVTVEAAAPLMEEVKRRPDQIVSIASQRRFASHNQYVHELISSGALGRVATATAELPVWRTQEYYDSGDWRGTWALDGGGALMNQGVHLVDMMLWLLGPCAEVQARAGLQCHERIEVEDAIVVAARMERGPLMTFLATTCAYPDAPIRYAIHGDGGHVVVEDEMIISLKTRDGHEVPDLPLVDQPMAQLDDFLQAVREPRPPLVGPEDGYRALAFVQAAYESARTGELVSPSVS